jgi:hypothetical protein
MDAESQIHTDLTIGASAIDAYSRLSYTMWFALAEFIDNSTQSRLNHGNIIDDVLESEGKSLTVEINYNRLRRELSIEDNSIGMTKQKLIDALQIASPTPDSKGRSKYGMGMKTAACWIGKRWKIVTAEWGSGEEWTADIDVKGIAFQNKRVPLNMRSVNSDAHYTKLIISDLNRNIQERTRETIRGYLGSIYRFDLQDGKLKILFDGVDVPPPNVYDFDTDPDGNLMKMDLPADLTIGGKMVTGWVGVLRHGGRKFGGFSLFQNKRQIQGFPNAWRPKKIFGGVDDEGANNLVSQRLTGVIELDPRFPVSHTKDSILFEGDEEEELEDRLAAITDNYRRYAQARRGHRGRGLNRESVREFVRSLQSEFQSPEMNEAVTGAVLPPISIIEEANQRLADSVTEAEISGVINAADGLRIIVSVKEVSEFEPYVSLVAGAAPNTMHVIVNGLHPYFSELDSRDSENECIRQYAYDAIAEYKVARISTLLPTTVRRLKDSLLRVPGMRAQRPAEGTDSFVMTPGNAGGEAA